MNHTSPEPNQDMDTRRVPANYRDTATLMAWIGCTDTDLLYWEES